VGKLTFLHDATRQIANHDIVLGVDLFDLDTQIAGGVGGAQQREALGCVKGGQGLGDAPGIVDFAFQDTAFAGSAGAVAAPIGQRKPLAERRVQHAFVGFGVQLVAAGFDVYQVAQGDPPKLLRGKRVTAA
jgi:hypothetical protein